MNRQNWLRVGATVFVVLIVLAYSYNLHYPPEPYFDEEHHAPRTLEMLSGKGYKYWATSHPPLWHLLTSVSVVFLGYQALAFRLVSLLAGLLALAMVYKIAKVLSKDPWFAFLSCFLVAFDCLSLTQTRIAMLNSLSLLFMLIAVWSFLKYYLEKSWSIRRAFFWVGLSFGLAVATKLSSMGVLLLIVPFLIRQIDQQKSERSYLLKYTWLYLMLLPFCLYITAHFYLPSLEDTNWSTIGEIQIFNLKYHLQEAGKQVHPYNSAWWSWPLMLRPIWFFFLANPFGQGPDTVTGIIAVGNPAIFWFMPIPVLFLFWRFLCRRDFLSGFVSLGFWSQWLFYALGDRLKYFHYFYFVMPYLAMATAYFLLCLWRRNIFCRCLVVMYLLAVVVLFCYWYPLLVGHVVSMDYYGKHLWFKGWV